MKIIKGPKEFKTLERIKLSPQFKIIITNYELQRKLAKRKVKENPLLDSLKMQLTKDESDKEYFLREMRMERNIGEEIKNMYGAKVFEGRSNKEIKLAEKKVNSEKKITKMILLENNPLFSSSRNKSLFYENHTSNNYDKNNNYNDINDENNNNYYYTDNDINNDINNIIIDESNNNDFNNNNLYYSEVNNSINKSSMINKSLISNKSSFMKKTTFINLPLIFPQKPPKKIIKKKIDYYRPESNKSSEKIMNYNYKDFSRSISSISNNNNINNVSNINNFNNISHCLSTRTLLDNLDSVRNSYRSVSRNLGKFAKLEKELCENIDMKYKVINNKFD